MWFYWNSNVNALAAGTANAHIQYAETILLRAPHFHLAHKYLHTKLYSAEAFAGISIFSILFI